jgi:uncharacterized protein (TIGR02421 family)
MATATANLIGTDADEPPAAPCRLTSQQTTLRELSDRLVDIQQPLRVLDAVRWDDRVENAFFAAGAGRQPLVGRDYYADRPLRFDPDAKRRELRDLERDVRRRLGPDHAAGGILLRMSGEYRQVVDLLEARGTPAFGALSARLYGGAPDRCLSASGGREPPEGAHAGVFSGDSGPPLAEETAQALPAPVAAAALQQRLTTYFGDAPVTVRLSDALVADAAAGGRCLRVRRDARFTFRDVRLLEVHEGWVHLGTTLNGLRQPICTFLSKVAPSATRTQEGLAVLTEVLAGASHPERVRRLTNRSRAVALAANGATFLDVYRFFLAEDYSPPDAYHGAVRVFRGSLPEGGGPFTKDLCYGSGLAEVSAYLAEAVCSGVDGILLLFSGKTSVDDVPALLQLAAEGLLLPPRFLPPPFADQDVLAEALPRPTKIR